MSEILAKERTAPVSSATAASATAVTPGIGAAPKVAVIGKIEPSAPTPKPSTASSAAAFKPPHRDRIVVPSRIVNGGFDAKFETDPYGINLRGLLTPDQYTDAITRINDDLRPSRSTKVDTALLVSGPLMVPLAVWGVRHGVQTKKRKSLLKKAIDGFNANYPDLLMRWNRRPESCLTIERRMAEHGSAPVKRTSGDAGGLKEAAISEDDAFV